MADDPPARQTAEDQLYGSLAQMLPSLGASLTATEQEAPLAAEPEPSEEPLDSSSITIDSTGLIEVHVRDANIAAVLEMLSYQARANIVATRSVAGTVSANLYGLTLREALDAILKPNNYAYCQVDNTIYVGTHDEIARHLPPPETCVMRLKYITADEALTAVEAVLSDDGEVFGSGADDTQTASSEDSMSVSGSAGGDYLIVTDYPDKLREVERLLAVVDVRPQQVLIEATILRATLNEDNEFGIDFTLLNGVDFQNVASRSATATNLTTGDIPPEKFEATTMNLNTNFLNGFPNGGFTFGIIRNNIATFVRALEEVTDVAVVANPKIIALNKQESEVIVGRRDGYLTTTVTETAAVQTVEFLETGTQVRLKPAINADGTVRLAIHPKDSNGGLTAANLPFEETTEAEAQIMVDDGHTVLIGGLFRERTVHSKGQVPIVGNIPILGLLAQRGTDTTVREEVIILLTVHVLKETQDEQDRFTELREDIERVRVGMRRGLLGSGRERLAQAFYQEAVRQTEAGHRGRALLNTRMALHNQPKHLAALRLKEQLTGEPDWDSTGTQMQLLLLDLIHSETHSLEEIDNSGTFNRPPMDLQLQRGKPPVIIGDDEGEDTP